MKLLHLLNLLLLVASWLLAVLGAYISLLSGLAPLLATLVLLTWTILSWLVARVSLASNRHGVWRLGLPAVFLFLSLACFNYSLSALRNIYLEKNGFPRRYYSIPQ